MKDIKSLLIKAPATAGAFYSFNHPKQPTNQPQIASNTWHD
ncbi:hypothetical protein SynBIOSE41_01339 [Synechococcus sp. BIOS-E4-1]|nr:hypothetical protein SynBIOSE41_01339 [Synechococcus sp. BIOS-E4-1]